MLDCRKCKHKDCDYKKEILSAISIIGLYTNYKVCEAVEQMIVDATESCQDFEQDDT